MGRKELLLTTMIEIFIYITTTSKTAVLIYIIFMILYFIAKNKSYRWVKNCINIFQKIGIEIMAIFSVVTAMIYKYGIDYTKENINSELIKSNVCDCKCCQLFTSNRQEGCKTVQEFYDKRFDRKSSPFSPKFLYKEV